jgi:Protein of unknown function (DUF3071)
MRALRVVGYGEDESGQPRVILEDPDRHERFTVPADERLRAAARGDVQRLGQMIASSSELESQLRPREIQARIRAGASVEQVAAAAGAPLQRIERFAYPVLLERSRMAELARGAHPVRPDGPDVRTLQEVVAHTFALRGQEYEEAEWDSWRGEDHKWVVALSWRVGRSDITARWAYHPGAHGGTVTALDEHALDLIDGNARPPRRVGPVIDFSKPESQPAGESRDTGAGAAGVARATGTDQPSRRANDQSGGRAPGTDPTGAAGSRAAAGSRDATGEDRSGRPATKTATKTATGSGTRAARAGAAEPEQGVLPGAEAEPAPGTPASDPGSGEPAKRTGGRKSKSKPVMPSWEDVLLGVKRS